MFPLRCNAMANPALKNGYISIANELVEQFALHNIPGNEMRIIWVVWRKTWGWKEGDRKKDWDWISISQLEKATGMKHATVAQCTKSLVGKRLLLKREKGLKFNQNYDEWVVGKRLLVVGKSLLPSREKPTKISREKPTYKRNKETNTKDTTEPQAALIGELIKSFEGINPSTKVLYGSPPQRKASVRLLEVHGLERIRKAIAYVETNRDDRFCPSITTPVQLEAKWAQLEDFGRKKQSRIKKVIL